jgi:hypothetical protein
MHDDGSYVATIDRKPAHINGRKRGEYALDPNSGKRSKELIIDPQVGASAVVALTDHHEARTAMSRQVIGERADRLPHPIGERLLSLNAIALIATNQCCDLLVCHLGTLYAWWLAQAIGCSSRSGA